MTIKEYAKEHGVSTQAVYKRIKRSEYDTTRLTEEKTGNLTAFGIDLLNTWYSQDVDRQHTTIDGNVHRLDYDKVVQERDQLAKQLQTYKANAYKQMQSLQQACMALQSRLDQAQEKIREYADKLTEAHTDRQRWFSMCMALNERIPKLVVQEDDIQKAGQKLSFREWLGYKIAGKK